jgi:arsenical pump membrane protein
VCGAIVILVDEPALPVLAIGLGAALVRGCLRLALRTIAPVTLLALMALAVGAGIVGRAWDGPSALVGQAAPVAAAAWSAGAAVTINNLPASLLLTGQPPADPIAILIGLGLGANLAVTGSLSVLLWWRAALTVSARPSALAYSRHGAPAALLGIAAAAIPSSAALIG